MAILVFDAAGSNPDGTDPGTALNIGPGGPYRLRSFSAPTPAQTVQYAGSVDTEGSTPVSRKHENRAVSLTIMCDTTAALQTLQGKFGKVAREGGTLKWTLPNATADVVFLDLLAVDTFDPTIDVTYYSNQGAFCEVQIVLPAKPYGRGASILLNDHTETTAPALTLTETGIKGDWYGLGSLVIDNDQAATLQETLIWGIQSRYTNTGIPLLVEAENTTYISGIGATAAVGPAGASGGGSNVLKTSTLSTVEQQLCVARFASVGTFNIFARVQAPVANAGLVSMRMRYGNIGSAVASDGDGWIELDDVAAGSWILVKLGQIAARQQLLASTGNWYFLVTGKTTSGSTDVLNVDYFLVVPVDEGYGEMYDPLSPVTSPGSNGSAILNDHDFQRYGGGAIGLGSDFDKPNSYEGDYLNIPPAGAEGRTLRIIVKFSRGQILTAPGGQSILNGADAGIDDLSARLTYTPRYLVVPSA